MYFPSFHRYVREALNAGIDYLLAHQSRDGFWRDYNLPPGMSEGWSTAWVGWSLAHCAAQRDVAPSIHRAALALQRCSQKNGWGYNRRGSTDADSTAWSLRLLSRMGYNYGLTAVQTLEKYLDAAGRAHTFLDPAVGSWSLAHDDVTPVVGLALLAVRAPPRILEKVRSAVLRCQRRYGGWDSFWWPTDAYATAWSLSFLEKTGSLPSSVVDPVTDWLAHLPPTSNAFELSHRLRIYFSLRLHQTKAAVQIVDALIDAAGPDGWPPSALLRIPGRADSSQSEGGLHPDILGLMTTGIACASLSQWLGVCFQKRESWAT
jgi:hypothetical protein